jgi:O-antigen ligase
MSGTKKLRSETQNKGIMRALIWGAAAVTLGIWTTFQDPFNPIKLALILITAAWLLGHLLSNYKMIIKNVTNRSLIILISLFTLALTIATWLTDNKRIAFIGDNQRNNGLLMYLGLSIILLTAAVYINQKNVIRILQNMLFLGAFLSIYGLFQISGVDIVKWNNPYNAVISTVGNPNFAAAIMAIMATVSFGLLFNSAVAMTYRIFSLLVCTLSLAAIYLSDARQGLIGIAIGFGTFVSVWIYSRSRLLGFGFISLGTIIGVFSILGMLQIGPLTSFLYKGSVTVRGFYWRAGIEMFRDNPIFGVGIDRYGAFFKEYREVGYPLNYGFNITSSNAHNLPIQMFATGGLLVGITYLFLNIFVLWRALKGLKSLQGNQRLFLAAVFSAWLVYQATSFISIDSPGIAVWGWLLAGGIVALSKNENESTQANLSLKIQKPNQPVVNVFQPILSSTFLVIALFFTLILFRGETNMFHTRAFYNPQIEANSLYLKESALKTINHPWINPIYKITAASYLANSGFPTEGIAVLEEIVANDKRSEDALSLLSTYYTQLNKLDLAIEKRNTLAKLDPWNAANYLELGRLYKTTGNFEKMNEVKDKILSFASETPEGKTALNELIQ